MASTSDADDPTYIGWEYVPEGAHIQLDPEYDISGLTADAQVVAQALKDYGAFVCDKSTYHCSIRFQNLGYGWWENQYPGMISSLETIPTSEFRVLECETVGKVSGLDPALEFVTGPPSVVEAGETFSVELEVDGFEIGVDPEADVMVAIGMWEGTNPRGLATLTGTVFKTTTDGVVTFDDLSIDYPDEGLRLFAMPRDGDYIVSDPFEVEVTVGVEDEATSPPDPFHLLIGTNPVTTSTTTVSYETTDAGHVLLQVFDVSGRVVQTLVDGWQEGGVRRVDWIPDGLSSGWYFMSLRVNAKVDTRKIVVLR